MLLILLFFFFITFSMIVVGLLDKRVPLICSILTGSKKYLRQDMAEADICGAIDVESGKRRVSIWLEDSDHDKERVEV